MHLEQSLEVLVIYVVLASEDYFEVMQPKISIILTLNCNKLVVWIDCAKIFWQRNVFVIITVVEEDFVEDFCSAHIRCWSIAMFYGSLGLVKIRTEL